MNIGAERSRHFTFEVSAVRCPDCSADLQETDFHGVRIDECPKCRGRWFDRDELRVAKDRTDDDLRWLDFDLFGEAARPLEVTPSGSKCPKCMVAMISLKYAPSQVVVDRCDQCQGVWLNHDEFERIVEYLEEVVSRRTAAEYAGEAGRQFLEILAGHKGAVSEIRDFLAVLHLLELRIAAEHPRIAGAANKIYAASPLK
jgi:Zn-finger nucleic acid-binding protein